MVELLFEDIFTLEALDPDGKKLDKGSLSLLYIAYGFNTFIRIIEEIPLM